MILAGYFLLTLHLFTSNDDNNKSAVLPGIIPLLLIVSFAFSLGALWGMWVSERELFNSVDMLVPLLFVPIIFMLSFAKRYKNITAILFCVLISAGLGLRLLALKMTPFPPIDTFIMLNEAPRKLLLGANPYTQMFTHVFPAVTSDYFTYWPAAFLLQLPFVALLGDPRFLFILSDMAAALLLFLIGGRSATSMALSILFLFRPYSMYLIEGSWLSPLNFVLILLCLYLLHKKAPAWMSGVVVGLVTGVQFFHAVLFLIIGKYLGWSKKFIAGFFITVVALVVPYFLAAPRDFLSDTVFFYFRNPPHPAVLIHESLNVNALFYYFFHHDISAVLLNGILLIALGASLWDQKKDVLSVAKNILFFFYTFFVFGRQAFVNYYFFIASLTLTVLAFELVETKKGKELA